MRAGGAVVAVIVMGSLFAIMVSVSPPVAAYTEISTPVGTVVSGVLDFDLTWTTDKSPYMIDEWIQVAPGATLTVSAGVVIRVHDDESTPGPEGDLWVDGSLLLRGSPTEPVVFKSNSSTPSEGAWRNLRINATGHLEMEWAQVSYAHMAPSLLSDGNFVRDSTITWFRNGTVIQGSFNVVQRVEFANSTLSGYAVDIRAPDNRVENSTIRDQLGGIVLMGEPYPVPRAHRTTISNNTFYNLTGPEINMGPGLTGVRIFHNAFLSDVEIYVTDGNAEWDNGYPSGGNYWADYTGVDNCSGPNQDVCPDPDEIGDTPYPVRFYRTGQVYDWDRYPLMCPPPGCDAPPAVTNASASPDPQELGSSTNVTATVTDDRAVAGVWLNVVGPQGPAGNATMVRGTGDTYYANRTYADVGVYAFTVWARDGGGRWASQSGTLSIVDTTSPVVADLVPVPNPQELGAPTNVSARVTDLGGIASVRAEVRFPDSSIQSYGLGFVSGTTYAFERTFGQVGAYGVTAFAEDPSGNQGSASASFIVRDTTAPALSDVRANPSVQDAGGAVNVSALVADLDGVAGVEATVWDPGGTPLGPFPLAFDAPSGRWFHTRTYGTVGTHTFEIRARDSSGNEGLAGGTFRMRDATSPVANAGPDRTVENGTWAQLDGTASSDDVGIVNYTWSFTYDARVVFLYGPTPRWLFGRLGTYDADLRVRDAEGNEGADVTRVTVVDTIPPGPPPALNVAPAARGELRVIWASSPDADVAAYVLDRGPTATGPWSRLTPSPIPARAYLDTGLADGATWCYRVAAVDAAGNEGPPSAAVCGTTIDDTLPPVADAGPDRVVTVGTVVQFDGTGSSDANGIANYTWTFDDGGPVVLWGPAPSSRFNRAGTFVVALTVEDPFGNAGADDATVTVGGDGRPRILAVLADPDPGERAQPVEVRAHIVDAALAGAWVEVRDPVGSLLTNSTMVPTADSEWFAASVVPSRIGEYALRVSARDGDGLWNASARMLPVADTIAPAPPTDLTATRAPGPSVNLTWSPSPSDDVAAYEVWRAAGSGALERIATVGASSLAYTDRGVTEGGTYRYAVRAIDNAGNASPLTPEARAEIPGSFPWWWIALFATLFTAVIVVAFWRKRKEKGTDGEGSPEEEHVT